MRSYLYVISKKRNAFLHPKESKKLIDELKHCSHEYAYHSHENIQCFAYTNEPQTDIEKSSFNNEFFFASAGQLSISDEEIINNVTKRGPSLAKEYIKNLPGAYSISFAHLPSYTVRAFTHFARVNPVYYFENEERIVIGLDPLVVNCIGNFSYQPVFNLDQSISFLMQGFFSDNYTVFDGVKSLPANSEICVENERISINSIDDSLNNMFSKQPTAQDYDELTELFLKSFDVIPSTKNPHRVGLTGGKDSRLIVLGLLSKDIPFKAHTRGFDDHPDVVLAKQIAKALDIEHTVKAPALNKNNQLEIDLVQRIQKVMLGTGGTVYGYENINYYPEYKNTIGITGVGAEVIRGGYGNLRKKERPNVGEELVKSFFPLKDYILPEKRKDYEEFLLELGENEKSFKEAQCKHYIFYRTGRWSGGTRSANSYSSNVFSPFFDNNFLKKATELDINVLANEKLHYNIMKRLNPKMVNLPFYNSRWLFEEKGPINPNDFNRWFKKQPAYANTTIGSYNWRSLSNEDDTLRGAFRKILLNDPSSDIFSLVDYNQIKTILQSPVAANLNKFIWSLVSLKIFMDYYHNPSKRDIGKLFIDLPESKIIKTSNKSVIKDLAPILKPTNKSLKVTKDGKNLLVNIDTKKELNPYIQTGDQSFTTPPQLGKETLNVSDSKKIFVRFCIETADIGSKYRLFTMFYDENNRISSESHLFTSKKDRTFLERNIKVPEKAKYVKFAVKFTPNKENQDVNLKYSYMKLT